MHVDAIVVGSGLCGSLAAQQLERAGHSVLVLEGGPDVPGPTLPGDVPEFLRAVGPLVVPHQPTWAFQAPRGYEWHRVRARGGRTLLWGGWMERPTADYFDARARAGAAWPEHLSSLAPWVRAAEAELMVRSGKRSTLHRALEERGFRAGVKRECVLPKSRRMLTAADLRVSTVRCDAAVVKVAQGRNGLEVHLANGERVSARRVVLAASPIETARIIEASLPEAQRRRRIPFFDHLIAGAIAITARATPMKHPRGAAENSAVIHPAPTSRVRFSTELRGPTPLESLDAEDLTALGFTREQAQQHSFYVVFAMGETDARKPRHLRCDHQTDGLGRPMPCFVARKHTDSERRLAKAMNARVLRIGRSLASSRSQCFLIYDALDFSSGGHEVGTCLELLDERGQVNALPGVFVADGAGVPAATDRHPSLTLAANALRVTAQVFA